MSIAYPFGKGTSMNIGGVSVPGVYEISDSGGQSAPEKRVERGFDWTTRIGPDPIEATYTARCDGETLDELKQLRRVEDPIAVSVGASAIGECVLDDLDWSESGDQPGAYDVDISIREVQLASTGEAQLRVVDDSGTKTESAGKSGEGGASMVQSDSESTSGGPEGGGDGGGDSPFAGIKSSVNSWLGYD